MPRGYVTVPLARLRIDGPELLPPRVPAARRVRAVRTVALGAVAGHGAPPDRPSAVRRPAHRRGRRVPRAGRSRSGGRPRVRGSHLPGTAPHAPAGVARDRRGARGVPRRAVGSDPAVPRGTPGPPRAGQAPPPRPPH